MVTGGTGSLGQNLVKRILAETEAREVIVYSRGDYKQYEMSQRTRDSRVRYVIGDVRDIKRLTEVMQGCNYVIHAAALKQIPIAEANPSECLKTNAEGTANVVSAAISCGVEKVIGISSDKAANPINIYGLSKLEAEKHLTVSNAALSAIKTKFAAVRYGNVIGSRGSVVQLFRQLAAKKTSAIPITHPEMTRFWITLKQATQLIFDSFERMTGGEVFVPKIPSMRIIDLANTLAPDIPQHIIGLRPGEKLHELLCPAETSRVTLEFPDHYVILPATTNNDRVNEYSNALGQRGSLVPNGFQYCSLTNTDWLSSQDLRRIILTLSCQ